MSAKNAGSTKFTLERRFPCPSGHQIFWVFQNMFLSRNLTFSGSRCMLLAQTSHNHILTWYQHQITTQWSSISQINHMHVPIYTKFTFNITISCIQAHTSYEWYMHVTQIVQMVVTSMDSSHNYTWITFFMLNYTNSWLLCTCMHSMTSNTTKSTQFPYNEFNPCSWPLFKLEFKINYLPRGSISPINSKFLSIASKLSSFKAKIAQFSPLSLSIAGLLTLSNVYLRFWAQKETMRVYMALYIKPH